ncbi:MAG: helix-turn-helix transcriptional regulator [Methylococcaceae bacterium]
MTANTVSTQPKPRNKITYTPAPLPAEGVVRLPSVLAVLGISKTSFLNGIKAKKYPEGKLLSPRCRVWRVESIRALIVELGGEA